MAVYVLLTLDLHTNVTDQQRKKFNESMSGAKWQKLDDTSTTYWARFKDETSVNGAYSTTESDLETAAKAAGGISVNAVAIASNDRGHSFTIGKDARR